MDVLYMIEAWIDRQIDDIPVVVEVQRDRCAGSCRVGTARVVQGPPCVRVGWADERDFACLMVELAEMGRGVQVRPVDRDVSAVEWYAF